MSKFLTSFWLLLVALPALAAEPATIGFSAERIEAAEWRVMDLRATFELSENGVRGEIRIGQIAIPAIDVDIADTVVACREVLLSRGWLRCHQATLTADFPIAGRQSVAGRFDYERDSGVTHFSIPRLSAAGGTVSLHGQTGESGSDLGFAGEALQLVSLIDIANALDVGPGELTASGSANASGTLRTSANAAVELRVDTKLLDASISNEAGTLVAEAVNASLGLQATRNHQEWQIDLQLSANQGEAYIEPVYANLSEHAVTLHTTEVRTKDFARFDISSFDFEQASQVSLAGSANITLPKIDAPLTINTATVDVTDTAVESVYTNLLQIIAAGTVLGDLETAGRIAGRFRIADNAMQSADLELTDVILDDRQRRFAIYGMNGTVHWPGPEGSLATAEPSRLRWDSGNAYGVLFDAAAIALGLGGDDLLLLEPLRLPTMGGALLINRLEVQNYGGDEARGLLDAELEPVQLGQVTGAFGWPAFSGSLSGRLPLLQYEGNAMTVGGSLTAQAFDGDIELSNLRIAQPFGRVPRLTGDLRLRRLDLERLTNTFSFGLIQGRLSGDVTGLRMTSWQPVAMDLHLYSAEDDRTPHRISQRAVENLASVGGGGAGAALSTGLLKFFEVFAYDRIGLRCVLRDGVCAMSGAGAAGEGARGYYIVRGSGIPRIDVIGYRERVGWPALVRQLSGITRSPAPVVQ